MTRTEILAAAEKCISHDRHASYGAAEDSLGAIAALWSADLGITITAVDVARLMVLMKMARAKANPGHDDSWVDAAGYSALAGELANNPVDQLPYKSTYGETIGIGMPLDEYLKGRSARISESK